LQNDLPCLLIRLRTSWSRCWNSVRFCNVTVLGLSFARRNEGIWHRGCVFYLVRHLLAFGSWSHIHLHDYNWSNSIDKGLSHWTWRILTDRNLRRPHPRSSVGWVPPYSLATRLRVLSPMLLLTNFRIASIVSLHYHGKLTSNNWRFI